MLSTLSVKVKGKQNAELDLSNKIKIGKHFAGPEFQDMEPIEIEAVMIKDTTNLPEYRFI